MAPQERHDPGRRAAIMLAVAVHVVLALLLVFGVRWSSEHPQPMVAELWSEIPQAQPPRAAPPQPEPKPEPRPVPKPEPRPEPKVEPAPPPKADIALEQEKKRKAEQKQKEAADKLEKERRAKADDARKKQEAEAARRRAQARIAEERKQTLAQLAEAADDTLPSKGPLTGAPVAGDPHARAGYVDKIRAKIYANIAVPPDIVGNPEAQYDVRQLPTGEVVEVKLRKSSGVRGYDDAVERAIWKSSPLPKPEQAEAFEPMLHLKFHPIPSD